MSQSADAREVLQAIEAKGPNVALDTRLKQVDRDDNAAGRGNAGSQSSTVDAKSRLPLCMPDTAPGVECVGPKDR